MGGQVWLERGPPGGSACRSHVWQRTVANESGQGPDRLASLNLIVTSRDRPDPDTHFQLLPTPPSRPSQSTYNDSPRDRPRYDPRPGL
eukprot:3067721-Rhodomonas_salina.1